MFYLRFSTALSNAHKECAFSSCGRLSNCSFCMIHILGRRKANVGSEMITFYVLVQLGYIIKPLSCSTQLSLYNTILINATMLIVTSNNLSVYDR